MTTVDTLILERLDAANLPPMSVDLVVGALLGPAEFAGALGGAPPPRVQPATETIDEPQPTGTYLSAIEVTGFRGIGPSATLDLVPAPGLTIVTGRNGSGKSSFAEAAELALTSDNRRWSGRTQAWREGWRNLHSGEESRIRVSFGVAGHHRGAVVERHWSADAGLDDATAFLQLHGKPRQPVAELGWRGPLELYRPFLSYAELGGLLSGRPSEMHDALERILGLERLVELETMLKQARKEADDQRKVGAGLLPGLRTALAEHPDPRARAAELALTDLDALAMLAESGDDLHDVPLAVRQLGAMQLPVLDDVSAEIARLRGALDRIAALAGTPAEEARKIAVLLDSALAHQREHPGTACPVCKGRDLDAAWVDEAQLEYERLTLRAESLDAAHRLVRAGWQWLRAAVPQLPAADIDGMSAAREAWQRWTDVLTAENADEVAAAFDGLHAAAEPIRKTSQDLIAARRKAWQPLVVQISTYVTAAWASRRAAANHTALQKAITWLRGVGSEIRNRKLEPIAQEATEIWNLLRQQSNVELGSVRLAGTGPTRRVDLGVTIDGTAGAALGVMSQGELHSLALALFLPRATADQSPFRFLIIDDPVQSMDPAKVYGLAEVLARVARTRQVVVFTHDDRLPAALRHLGLPARIVTVNRLPKSEVVVDGDRDGDPALRYLGDARAIASDDEVEDSIRSTVVCNLVRDALEFTGQETVRIRDFRAGRPMADTEADLAKAKTLNEVMILTLGAGNGGSYQGALSRLDPKAREVVRAANNGAHGQYHGAVLHDLITDAERVIGKLRKP